MRGSTPGRRGRCWSRAGSGTPSAPKSTRASAGDSGSCTGEEVEYSGEYLEIDRPHRLVSSLFVEKCGQWDDRVIVELAPVADQTLLVLTHELSLPNPAQRSRVQRGWARVMDGLAVTLATRAAAACRPSEAPGCARPLFL